ncbi:hypothetical protein [Hymenobacter properus]|uniref:CBM-cenC domain-containing protein n=1 Tax=Hymenobacter properus TaxID=2791026 RepID=A0A931FKI1_9BACT|nr:hypothetical protein [Hymenobacter properus]MBF9143083.1 hypothetical protein [Hymenobacter properus]MBR7721891.1 hypothetical protein [Microvirga sp. SRT04]
MKNTYYSFLALVLAACGHATSEKPAGYMAGNDFESVAGWTNGCDVPPSLTTSKAHSGRYSVKVGPAAEYSLGYSSVASKLSTTRFSKLKIKAWVNVPNDKSAATLVVEVDPATTAPDQKPLLWKGLELAKTAGGYNKWVEVEQTVDMPATITPESQLKVYMWRGANAGAEDIYLDDIELLNADK